MTTQPKPLDVTDTPEGVQLTRGTQSITIAPVEFADVMRLIDAHILYEIRTKFAPETAPELVSGALSRYFGFAQEGTHHA